MTKKIYSIATVILSFFLLTGCDTDPENIKLIGAYEKSDAYYAALREWKANPEGRPITFVYYAAYAPVEGVSGWKDPASYGERFIGLPDSIDIVSLWMGIPNDDPESDDYAPTAYEDMRYCQQKKGMRFVTTTITRMQNRTITLRDGTEYNLGQNLNEEGIKVWAQYLVDQVLDNDLDGLDLDYEPETDWFGSSSSYLQIMVEYIGQYFGPKGIYPDKLFILDYWSNVPGSSTHEYIDYLIKQAYGPQSANGSDAILDSQLSRSGIEASKFIVVENFGEVSATGGVNYTDEFGNTESSYGGRMTSMEGQARWARRRGAAGFGAFYVGRDYYGEAGPYGWTRRAITIANQSEEEFNSFYE